MNTPLESWRLPSMQTPDRKQIEIVFEEVAGAFGFTTEQMHARDRHCRLAWARQVAMTLLIEIVGCSDGEAATLLFRERSTVTYARNQVTGLCEVYPKLAAEIDLLRNKIRNRLNSTLQPHESAIPFPRTAVKQSKRHEA